MNVLADKKIPFTSRIDKTHHTKVIRVNGALYKDLKRLKRVHNLKSLGAVINLLHGVATLNTEIKRLLDIDIVEMEDKRTENCKKKPRDPKTGKLIKEHRDE